MKISGKEKNIGLAPPLCILPAATFSRPAPPQRLKPPLPNHPIQHSSFLGVRCLVFLRAYLHLPARTFFYFYNTPLYLLFKSATMSDAEVSLYSFMPAERKVAPRTCSRSEICPALDENLRMAIWAHREDGLRDGHSCDHRRRLGIESCWISSSFLSLFLGACDMC